MPNNDDVPVPVNAALVASSVFAFVGGIGAFALFKGVPRAPVRAQ